MIWISIFALAVWAMAFYTAVTGDLSWHSQSNSLNNPIGWGVIYFIAYAPLVVLALSILPYVLGPRGKKDDKGDESPSPTSSTTYHLERDLRTEAEIQTDLQQEIADKLAKLAKELKRNKR